MSSASELLYQSRVARLKMPQQNRQNLILEKDLPSSWRGEKKTLDEKNEEEKHTVTGSDNETVEHIHSSQVSHSTPIHAEYEC